MPAIRVCDVAIAAHAAILRRSLFWQDLCRLLGLEHAVAFNCLAIGDGWVLAVLLRYPGKLGFAHGRSACQSVAQQLLAAR